MRGVSQGRVSITANLVSHLDLCLQCRNCEAVCPSGVRYGHIMEGARAEIMRDGHRAPWPGGPAACCCATSSLNRNACGRS